MFKGACPLTLNERVAWSFIVDRTPVGGATAAEISRATGLEQGRTVPAIKKELVGKHLAEVSGNRLVALPPDPEWAVSRADDGKTPWHKRLLYFPLCWKPTCWTVAQNVVYHCLLTSNMQCAKKIRPNQRKAGIAAMLGISHDTVERAFKLFEEEKLIEYGYLRTPSAEILSHFLNQPNKRADPAAGPWMASMACEWPFGDWGQGPWMAQAVDTHSERLLKVKYSHDDIVKYWGDVYRHARTVTSRCDEVLYSFLHNWVTLFTRIETETERNRRDGKFKGPNSLGMLTSESKASVGRSVMGLTRKII
jgi:hypothetical protein